MRLSQVRSVFKAVPAALTPYDLLKTMVILLMIVDHLGYYFLTDENTYRLIGRLCVPIWLFLIGYARSRTLDRTLIAGAIFISLLQLFWHQGFHTLNILWTIIAIRLTLDPLMRWIGTSENRLFAITFVFTLAALPTRIALDYGTFAWVLAIWGYMVRHNFSPAPQNTPAVSDATFIPFYGILTLALFVCIESLQFGFAPWQIVVLAAGCLALYPALALYLPRGTKTGTRLPAWLRGGISAVAHHTLAIYVLHISLAFGILFAMRFAH